MNEYNLKIEADITRVIQLQTEIVKLDTVLNKLNIDQEPKLVGSAIEQMTMTLIETESVVAEISQLVPKVNTEVKKMEGVIQGLSALSSTLDIVQNSMSIFGASSEQLAAVQEKLQTVIAITNAAMEVSAALKEKSAFRTQVVAGATSLWSGAIEVLNGKLGIGLGLSRALVAGGIGALIAGIAVLVSKYQSWKKEQEEINRLNNIVPDTLRAAANEGEKSALKQTASLDLLYEATQNTTKSLEERTRAAKELQNLYPKYFGNMSKEEILAGNAAGSYDRLKQSIINSAIARAYADKIAENGLKIFEIEQEQAALQKKAREAEARKLKSQGEEFNSNRPKAKNTPGTISMGVTSKSGIDLVHAQIEQSEIDKLINDKEEQKNKIIEINKELAKNINVEDFLGETKAGSGSKSKREYTPDPPKIEQQSETDKVKEEEKKEIDELLAKYRDYEQQRKAIKLKSDEEIAKLEKEQDKAFFSGDQQKVKEFTRAIVKATADAGKELMTFDLKLLKESPEYVRAFADLKNTSSETLNSLLSQFEEYKQRVSETLDPKELQEYTATIEKIIDELSSRDAFKALADSQKELAKASVEVSTAKVRLDVANQSGDTEKIKKATQDYNKALDDQAKASDKASKAQKEVNKQMNELFDAFSNVGNAIGGTAGEIIGFIADIGKFVTTTIDGVEMVSRSGAQAISTVEKASVILGIISAAIQLMKKLGSLVGDSHDDYLKYAKKIAEINKLRDAVNSYELAVTKARHAEENWFSKDGLKTLKQAKEEHENIASAYFDKLTEEQAIYQNKSGLGWTGKISKIGQQVFNTVSGNKLIDKIFGTNISNDLVDIVSGGTYSKGTTAAINNLRIETRKAKSGVFGSGIGGKSQKTEDLQTWLKKQKGFENAELFDKDGFINTQLANQVIETYGDKLVGQTKETLEALVQLKEQYDEYQKQLKEYVSSMYEPLVDNLIDSLWDWFDEGKDALDSFKDYASQTFRNIVSDMMRTIILNQVVGSFGDDINELYEKYSSGESSEQQLLDAVAKRTGTLIDDFEKNTPVLQKLMTNLNESLEGIGIDMKNTDASASQDSTKRGFETMTQDQAGELNGRFTALQMAGEELKTQNILQTEIMAQSGYKLDAILVAETEQVNIADETRDLIVSSYLELQSIRENTGAIVKPINNMSDKLDTIERKIQSL